MRRAFALVILSNSSSRLRASLRDDRKQWRLEVLHQIQSDAATGFSNGVLRGIARLVKKPMATTPKLELEDGVCIINERQATECWMRFALERHDGQRTSATALLDTIAHARAISPLRYDRSAYAHDFLMWCIYSDVSNLGVLGRRILFIQTCFAAYSSSLGSYFCFIAGDVRL